MRTPERLEASIRSGVNSVPLLNEVNVEEDVEPILVTNAARRFVPTRRSKARGIARYGFSEVPLEEEGRLLTELYLTLLQSSWEHRWSNRCSSVADAVNRIRAQGMEPSYLIVPEASLPEICGPEYSPEWTDQLMMSQGFVATVDGIKILSSDLPEGSSIVTASPTVSGLYTRVGDFLGVMVQRADRAWMVVGNDLA